MINADCTITIFNCILDKENRRELFLPTIIDGASYHEAEAVQGDTGLFVGRTTVHVRIPITANVRGGKQYIDHNEFAKKTVDEAANFWTIRNEDVFMLGAIETDGPITDALNSLKEYGRAVLVINHADNTHRGSPIVRHWRMWGD